MFVVRFQGGLANQIFQYAFYLGLKESYPNEEVYADLRHYKKCHDHGGFKLNKLVGDGIKYIKRRKFRNYSVVTENTYDCFCENYECKKKYYFNGYWQEERFFINGIEKIRELFSVVERKGHIEYLDEINTTESVSLHVRRGDYVDNFLHGNISTRAYFQNAISYIEKNVSKGHFFVFSDDVVWCKNYLTFNLPVTYVEGNEKDEKYDLLLMSKCKHNIISNSSFSWWAQQLNSNSDKIIISPSSWFNENIGFKPLCVDKSIRFPNYGKRVKTENDPFFSILISADNDGEYIGRCIGSVVNQIYDDIEIIIVDDCSSDGSWASICCYAEADKRINVLKNEKNEGTLISRRKAMQIATGKYILLLNMEDYLADNVLLQLHDTICKYESVGSVDSLAFSYVCEPSRDVVEPGDSCLGTFWNKCYSHGLIKNVLDKLEVFSCWIGADIYLAAIADGLSQNSYFCNHLVVHHLVHKISIENGHDTTRQFLDNTINGITNLKGLLNEYEKRNTNMPFDVNKVNKQLSEQLEDFWENLSNSGIPSKDVLYFAVNIDEKIGTDFCEKLNDMAIKYSTFFKLNYVGKIKCILLKFFEITRKKLLR